MDSLLFSQTVELRAFSTWLLRRPFSYLFQSSGCSCTLHWPVHCRLLLLLLCGCHCTRPEYEYGRCVDFCIVKYVTWFFEFIYWHMLNYAKAPGPSEDRGEMAMAIARSPGPPVRSTTGASFSPLHSFAVPGASGHNRGEAVERQPLARTQGRKGTWTVI